MSFFGRKGLAWKGALAVLILAIGAGGMFSLSQSGLLAIDNIEVEGNRAIGTDEILDRVGFLLHGQSLLTPSFSEAERSLSELPLAESVEIERDFPDTVRIRIREYRPFVSLKAAEDKVFILSAEGRTLMGVDAPSAELPLLSTREACATQPGSMSECPDVLTGLWFLANIPVNFNQEFSEVTVAGGEISAKTRSGVAIRFGTLDDYGLKFEVLRQLLARSVGAGASVSIDVSVPERPVTKDNTPPVAAAPPAEAEPAAEATAPTPDQAPAADAGQTGAPAEETPAPAGGTE